MASEIFISFGYKSENVTAQICKLYEEGNASLFFSMFFVRPSLGENFRFLIANTHTYNAHAILGNMGISWLHTRWTPNLPSIHTPSLFGKTFIIMATKHKKERPWHSWSIATAESRKKARVVQLDSRGLGGGEHGE